MVFLDWTKGSFSGQVAHVTNQKNQLVLKIKSQEHESLVQGLEAVFLRSEGELRLVLPAILTGQWVLFWKQRESGSRALAAHPEEDQWVGTVALEQQDGISFLLSLKNMEEGQSLSLGEAVSLISLSNLDLQVVLIGDDKPMIRK